MPENTSLIEALRRKLCRAQPRSLGALIQFFSGAEEYLEFVRIVRELLPEREADILSHPSPSEQIGEFATHFQTRYFPLEESFLWDMDDFSYADFLRIIPVQVFGMDCDSYHEMQDTRPGMQLMTYLFENPWEEDDGARVALAEMCAEHVSTETLESIPEGGLKLEAAEPLLKGTRFEVVFHWGEYLYQSTGNFFLDTDYEYLWSGYGAIDWERDTIEELTRQWLQHERLWQEFVSFAEWLEESPDKNFREVVEFIKRKL